MRTTVDLDEGTHQLIKSIARSKRQTMWRVICDLVRKAFAPDPSSPRVKNGVPLVNSERTGHITTLEDVNRIRDGVEPL